MCKGSSVVGWEIVFSRQAVKDSRKIAEAGLRPKVEAILEKIRSGMPYYNTSDGYLT